MNKRSMTVLICFFTLLIASGVIYKIMNRNTPAQQYDNLQVILPGIEISALFDDGEKLWTGTAEGIYLLDRDTGDILGRPDADIHMIYSAMIKRTGDGLIWAGHEDGLSAFDTDGNEILRFDAPMIPGGRVNAILAEEDGLWAGSQEGAAHLVREEGEWRVDEILTTSSGLAEDVVQVIEKVGDELWFGSYLARDKGGISIRTAAGWEYLGTDDGIPHRYINAILPLDSKNVLIGSGQLIYGGLSVAERTEDGWKIRYTRDQNDGIPGMKVRWLFLDSAGKLWITTEADGIIILDSPDMLKETPLKGLVLKQENGLADDEIKCIEESDKCYWLGGKYGLTRYGKDLP